MNHNHYMAGDEVRSIGVCINGLFTTVCFPVVEDSAVRHLETTTLSAEMLLRAIIVHTSHLA